jgi:hypothetical protein
VLAELHRMPVTIGCSVTDVEDGQNTRPYV